MKTTDEMNIKELTEWSRGQILIAIGEGKFYNIVWTIVSIAWQNGYRAAKEGK